jgi:hypothetical protein
MQRSQVALGLGITYREIFVKLGSGARGESCTHKAPRTEIHRYRDLSTVFVI